METEDDMTIPDDVSEALLRQDRALSLLERLRSEEPVYHERSETAGGGRRDFRRWPTPPGVVVALHDELTWRPIACLDLGVGGARVEGLPDWVKGPVPARLSAPEVDSVIVLADVMWRSGGREAPLAGLRFEFFDEDERELWSGALIDALLARHSLA